MKTALNQLIENINLMIEMAEIDKIKATEVNSFTLKARAEGQIQAFNMMLKEIEQLLSTERETTETLKKEIEELNKEREWISVEDGFPENCTNVLINSVRAVNEAYYEKERFYTENGKEYNYVTHWMPLPTPPKTQ